MALLKNTIKNNIMTTESKYKYDGEHIIFEIYSNVGIVSGTIKDGKFDFTFKEIY